MIHMRKLVLWLTVILLLIGSAAAEVTYTGTVTKDMTIRKTKSTSGTKLGSVKAGDTVLIESYDDSWTKIVMDNITGYILSKNVTDLVLLGAPADAEIAVFSGTATKNLTIRNKKSKSAPRVQDLETNETVYILELGNEWMHVVKNGIEGYVLSSGIDNITSLRADVEVPEAFKPEPPFVAYYTATPDINLTIRKESNTNAAKIGVVYEDERIEVTEIDGEWAKVRKKDTVGYVLSEHLKHYRRTDPFGPYIPGVEFLPYAAILTEDVDIYDVSTGEKIRTLHAPDIIAVSALDDQMSVTLPYQRTRARITSTANLSFEDVHSWDNAQPGDLIAIFTTFYAEAPTTEKEVGRLYNIKIGVDRLDGVRIPASAEFRFNDYCAPYTKGNGYVEGPIINYVSSKKMGYGGGICQVSTTLYNAVLQIPIEIVKQAPHSAYGIFYAPIDLDAAVGAGNLDLRFRNEMPYDIELRLSTQDGVMCVRIYRCSE